MNEATGIELIPLLRQYADTAEAAGKLHWATAMRKAVKELVQRREDTERLDALQAMTKGYGRGWILRESVTGRGMRLHETSHGEAHATVRAAIDAVREGKDDAAK